MSGFYENFEKRFDNKWFSIAWIEVDTQKQSEEPARKNLDILLSELEQIEEHIELVMQKQLRLSNLAKLYE